MLFLSFFLQYLRSSVSHCVCASSLKEMLKHLERVRKRKECRTSLISQRLLQNTGVTNAYRILLAASARRREEGEEEARKQKLKDWRANAKAYFLSPSSPTVVFIRATIVFAMRGTSSDLPGIR